MNKSKTKNGVNPIWKFFSSVKLTIVILILLAIVCIIGTVVPQNEGAREFAKGLSPQTISIFTSLNLFDMYHALWFRIMIACMTLNLIVCSIDRFPATWKKFKLRPDPGRNRPFEDNPENQSFTTKGSLANAATHVGDLLHSRFKNTREKEEKGARYFYAEKGRFSHFGVYIVHLSVLLILSGALIGSFFGFEAYVNIVEGNQTDQVMLRKSMQPMNLDFTVRCDKFSVDFYDTGAPKEYRSVIGFIVDGKEVKKSNLLVNHPAEFMGVAFYQASYGTVPGKAVNLKISLEGSDKKPYSVIAEMGKEISLPEGKGSFQVADVRADIMRLGPAALISIKPKTGNLQDFWIFKNYEMAIKKMPAPMINSPKFNPSSFKPYTFSLQGIETKYYTGLQVNRDPGVNIVWAGCFFMIAGLFATFFMSHQRIWVRIERSARGTRISIAGTANKNPVGLEREIEKLLGHMKDIS